MSVGLQKRRAFAVPYHAMQRWSVNSFFKIAWAWGDADLHPLKNALKEKKVRLRELPSAEQSTVVALTIKFDGTMRPREGGEYSIKPSSYIARDGDVVYSKIDVRNGAIGVVPNDIPVAAVTTEFPVFDVDTEVAVPAYIQLLFQTSYFRAALNSLISGAGGRKRINPAQLRDIIVPLPHVTVQQRIVDRWHEARKPFLDASRELSGLIDDVDQMIRTECVPELDQILRGRFMAVPAGDLARWDLKSARASRFRAAHPAFVPLGNFIVDATTTVDPRSKPDHEWPVYGVNNRGGVFFSHYQPGRDFNASYKAVERDWFFHNPTRANVGSLGIVPEVEPDAVTSPEYQVWKIEGGLIPGFMAVVVATPIFRELVSIHRVGGVKQRLFVENLRQIPLPEFDTKQQNAIAKRREAALGGIAVSEVALQAAMTEIEDLIVGRRKLTE